ncbi:ATP-binding protein [Streptomyces sp. NPDC005813]|uniref:ATP-binding protein n=1 Tax=Streptomyces sp. NPDC005813 TaxID=3155592 RepID=UPI0033FA0FDB
MAPESPGSAGAAKQGCNPGQHSSELATNALRHGGGRYAFEPEATASAVHVAVSDLNPAFPRERAPDLNGGVGGFGWPMVRRLADEVTFTPAPGPDKTIRVRLPR